MGRRGTRLGREMYREPGRLAGLDVEAERTFAAPVERDQGELVVPGLELEVGLGRDGLGVYVVDEDLRRRIGRHVEHPRVRLIGSLPGPGGRGSGSPRGQQRSDE